MFEKFKDWWYVKVLQWKYPPCVCCTYRTSLSVCRNEALKSNWEEIKSLVDFNRIHNNV